MYTPLRKTQNISINQKSSFVLFPSQFLPPLMLEVCSDLICINTIMLYKL